MKRALFFCLIIISMYGISSSAESPSDSLNRLRALGQAYMEDDEFEKAVDVYKQAVALVPKSVSDLINLGIAYYHGGINDQSMQTLKQALTIDPNAVFAFYTLGLAYKKSGDSASALECFRKVAEQDSTDVANLYNLGLAHSKTGKEDEAVPWFKKVVDLDPKHTSSYYQLMQYSIRHKDTQKAKEYQKIFLELKKHEAQRPQDAIDEGKFLGPIGFNFLPEQRPKFSSDLPVKFTVNDIWKKALLQNVDSERSVILTTFPDIQNRDTIVILSTDTSVYALTLTAKGELKEKEIIAPASNWSGGAIADYDNDGRIDLLVYSREKVLLLHNEGGEKYTDVTAKVGLKDSSANDALWVDFDHEGDLDLLLANPQSGDVIYRNNGNGTFENITASVEGLTLGKSLALAASDLDNDNDLDIIHLAPDGNLEIFANNRELHFSKACSFLCPTIKDQALGDTKIQITDIDNDSQMEILLLNYPSDNGEGIFKIKHEKAWSLQPITNLIPAANTRLQSVFDVNNDGFEDFLCGISNNTTPLLFLNQTPLPPHSQPDAVDKNITGLRQTFPLDFDYDGDLDLLANTTSGLCVWENQGGNQNRWLAMQINGKKNTSLGYGSKIQIKDNLFYVKKEVAEPVTHIGLGERSLVDVLRLTWPNGIFQNVVHATAGQILSVTEKPGYAGSCPFVYAWNGKRFEFIADALSTGPLGLYVGGGYFPPNSDEYIRIRGDQLQEKEGVLSLRLKEELREIAYLDDLQLLSVSHSSNLQVFANDCFTMPPFPEFKLIGMSNSARPPRRVVDQHGNDVTDLIRKRDLRYPQPFSLGHFEGVGEEYTLEIDLGEVDPSKPLYLFMTGYVDWPNSSTARSLEQHPTLKFVMPYLQVKNERDEWETIKNPMGFPAGKLKTVPLDLTNIFRSADHTLRIVSTLQVFWDQFLVDPSPVLEGFEIQSHPFLSAELRYGGYSRPYQLASAGPHWYDYSTPTDNLRWDHQTGFYTHYGTVLPLLQGFDDQYVIMGDGDEVAVEFAPHPIKSNESITYFLKLTGWVKDADYSTAFGQTVEPLPFRTMSAYPYPEHEHYPYDETHLQYLLQYNTREIIKQNEPLRIPKGYKHLDEN